MKALFSLLAIICLSATSVYAEEEAPDVEAPPPTGALIMDVRVVRMIGKRKPSNEFWWVEQFSVQNVDTKKTYRFPTGQRMIDVPAGDYCLSRVRYTEPQRHAFRVCEISPVFPVRADTVTNVGVWSVGILYRYNGIAVEMVDYFSEPEALLERVVQSHSDLEFEDDSSEAVAEE